MAKRALVTGAAGFVGRHFVSHLDSLGGWDVHGVDVEWEGDVLDLADPALSESWPRYDLVVHAAARSAHRAGIDSDLGAGPYNAMLDAAVIEWAIRTKQPRLVYLSSCAVYAPEDYLQIETESRTFQPISEHEMGLWCGGEVDIYGTVKRAGERLCEQATAAGVGVTIVRPFSGYGEDQGTDWPFGAFRDRARECARTGAPFEVWGSGRQVRDWVHVDDVVDATMALVEAEVREPVNICTGVGTSMLELARRFMNASGADGVGMLLRDDRPEGAPYRVGDPTLLHRYYTPRVTLDEGVRRALATG